MDEQFYCLHLDDYSAAAFTSFGKAYYGTMDAVKAFIDALGGDPERSENYAKLIAAFREYEAGNTAVKHSVAYQEIPLLEPVKLLGKATLRLDNYRWEHLNTWRWPYNMKCDVVDTTHYWFALDGIYCRAVKARFDNLRYEDIGGGWTAIEDRFWGFPMMIVPDGRYLVESVTLFCVGGCDPFVGVDLYELPVGLGLNVVGVIVNLGLIAGLLFFAIGGDSGITGHTTLPLHGDGQMADRIDAGGDNRY